MRFFRCSCGRVVRAGTIDGAHCPECGKTDFEEIAEVEAYGVDLMNQGRLL